VKSHALEIKCPSCRNNPGVACPGQGPCKERVRLAKQLPQARIDRLEEQLAEAQKRIDRLEKTIRHNLGRLNPLPDEG